MIVTRLPLVLLLGFSLFGQPKPDPVADLLKQGQQKMRDGYPDEALVLYEKAFKKSPKSFPANIQVGAALDLAGKYKDARKHFSLAMKLAPSPESKIQAWRSLAMSFAFENDCRGAAKYENQAYEWYLNARDFNAAGEVANELARVCIESGSLDEALKWYRSGYEAGLREPDIKPERKDLWEFRWEHAQARIAARRGNKDEALKHMQAAKSILDKGTNPQQAAFLPYLTGYVAFYAGDYKTALGDLQKANQDPFILCLEGQAYEKLGEKDHAMECYRKASTSTAHNPPNAFAHPFTKKKLG